MLCKVSFNVVFLTKGLFFEERIFVRFHVERDRKNYLEEKTVESTGELEQNGEVVAEHSHVESYEHVHQSHQSYFMAVLNLFEPLLVLDSCKCWLAHQRVTTHH
jgi:hypothetical protein